MSPFVTILTCLQIRCLPDQNHPEGRCLNCQSSEKECIFTPIRQPLVPAQAVYRNSVDAGSPMAYPQIANTHGQPLPHQRSSYCNAFYSPLPRQRDPRYNTLYRNYPTLWAAESPTEEHRSAFQSTPEVEKHSSSTQNPQPPQESGTTPKSANPMDLRNILI